MLQMFVKNSEHLQKDLKKKQFELSFGFDDMLPNRNTDDPKTLSAKIYEVTQLDDVALEHNNNPTNILPFVSIIIPTYNDSNRLRKCLGAMTRQTYNIGSFEVIVVDNNSEEDIQAVCSEFKSSNVKYLKEEKKGSYAARNKGLSIVQGDIIGFTDSDCIPAENWIEEAVKEITNNKVDIIGGEVDIFYRDKNNPTPVELYEGLFAFNEKARIERHHYSVTANLFTFKSVIDKVGYFDESLFSGGDALWCKKAYSRGFRLMYSNRVIVQHPARYSFPEIKSKVLRLAGGMSHYKRVLFGIFINPYTRIVRVLVHNKYTLSEKFKIVSVIIFIQQKIVYESIRLFLGKEPNR